MIIIIIQSRVVGDITWVARQQVYKSEGFPKAPATSTSLNVGIMSTTFIDDDFVLNSTNPAFRY